MMTLADFLGASGTFLNLPPGAGTTTLESKTNFISVREARRKVTAVCEPVHKGKSTQVWRTTVTRADGRTSPSSPRLRWSSRARPRQRRSRSADPSLFQGKSLAEQKAILAQLERGGAAIYRAWAGQETDEAEKTRAAGRGRPRSWRTPARSRSRPSSALPYGQSFSSVKGGWVAKARRVSAAELELLPTTEGARSPEGRREGDQLFRGGHCVDVRSGRTTAAPFSASQRPGWPPARGAGHGARRARNRRPAAAAAKATTTPTSGVKSARRALTRHDREAPRLDVVQAHRLRVEERERLPEEFRRRPRTASVNAAGRQPRHLRLQRAVLCADPTTSRLSEAWNIRSRVPATSGRWTG